MGIRVRGGGMNFFDNEVGCGPRRAKHVHDLWNLQLHL